jgi:hypothetical protein
MLAATVEINAADELVLLRNSALVTPSILCSKKTSMTVEAVGENVGDAVGVDDGREEGMMEGSGVGDP